MIDKDTGEPAAHRFGKKRGAHGGVHSAGQSQQDPSLADLLPELPYGPGTEVLHGPVARGAAHVKKEIAQHLLPVFCMIDLGMELHAVKPPFFIRDGGVGAGIAPCDNAKAVRYLRHIVAVTHPGHTVFGQAPEQRACRVKPGLRFPVLPRGIVLSGGDSAAEVVREKLAAITDAEDGDAEPEKLGVCLRAFLIVNAAGTSGEYKPDRLSRLNLAHGGGKRLYLAVDAALPYAAGDKLIVLAAEVKDYNFLVFHLHDLTRLRFL